MIQNQARKPKGNLFRHLNRLQWAVLGVAMCLLLATAGKAQNAISGEISGTVTDASGSVVPNVTVTITSADSGFTETSTTTDKGTYRFSLLKPGTYNLTITASGFSAVKADAVVAVGQVTDLPLQLKVGGTTQTVEVTAEAPLVQTDNGNISTSFDSKFVDLIPSPGQDITNYAFTAPGVTLSTGAGYGNFTANGLPGTSNLFTVNGNDYNDPYNNLNNSGASNLLLGANELQEITVTSNGYTGEYGRAAGANVAYSTKSGSNQFHGNAAWFWNGRYLNANDWFNNSSGTPRPFANSNQWAGSFGGPIKKNKLFFFYDNEGLRYVLPSGGLPTFVPSQAFQTAVIANLTATNPTALPFYNNIFTLYNGAPGIGRAVPVTTTSFAPDPTLGCGSFTGPAPGGGTFGLGGNTSCSNEFISTVNNLNIERLQAITVDLNATEKDTVKWRYKQDRGVQATGTDPINSLFNANSVQPEDDGQMSWTHVINGHTTNQLIASGLYYSAKFGPPNLAASLALFPTTIAFADGSLSNIGGTDFNYPQGRNVTQWQIVDDLSWTKGNHGIKFGVNFRRNDITSFAAGPLTSGLITINSLADFVNGNLGSSSTLTQNFANALEQPVAFSSLGLYAQDEWRVSNKLKLTLALRADLNSNEVCQHNCFSRPNGAFLSLDHNVNTPYNATVQTGLHQAFSGIEKVAWQPKFGFAYTPTGNSDLVVRGGLGLFSDLYQGFIADRFITNLPNVSSFTVTGGGLALAPGTPANAFDSAAASNAALVNAFATGGTLASIQGLLPGFQPPNINTIVPNLKNPKYVEWNLEVQKAFGSKTAFTVNYVGNHGYNLFIRNLGLNTFCDPSKCPNGFAQLPSAPVDQRFGVVTELRNNGRSNYNGITASVSRRFTYGFQGTFNYTYSHTLDDLSNGGLLPYSLSQASNSLRVQINPQNLNSPNYGNADYDFPHTISANYYWQLPYKSANRFLNQAIAGWSVSGAVYFKSGEPFSVYNNSIVTGTLGNGTGNRVLADYLGGPQNCGAPHGPPPNPCVSQSQFAGDLTDLDAAQFNFGNTSRNFFRGPHYFNSDFSVQKNFPINERGMAFTFGANAFNVFNHPNFGNPVGSLSSGVFGQLLTTVTPPNSPYGNFQGSAVSGRVLQLDLKFKF